MWRDQVDASGVACTGAVKWIGSWSQRAKVELVHTVDTRGSGGGSVTQARRGRAWSQHRHAQSTPVSERGGAINLDEI